jgi:ribose transport system permease protein
MSAAGMAFVLLSANSRGGVDLGFWAFAVAIGIGSVLGFINGVLFTKVKVPSFIVTLGMWYVGLGIATIMFGTDTMPFLTDDKLSTWASQLNFGLPNNFLLGALVAVLGALLLRFTSFGRVTLAVGNNEEIAKGNGLKVTRNKITIFTLAGAISGIAGIVATIQLGAVNPTVAAGNLFITIPAVVIGGTSLAGGKGGMFGTFLGVVLLTTLNNGLILAGVSPNFQSAVSGGILVLAIVATAWSQRDRLRISK